MSAAAHSGRRQTDNGEALAVLTDRVSDIVLKRPAGRGWLVALICALLVVAAFVAALGYLFATGVGIWGINIPVAWGFAITNYVWWIGIAMAGTFISAALLLLRQPWRTGISRFAETMTVMALAIAGLFPIMHLGRPWFAYWLFPYPSIMGVWPQWRSALVWDFVAIACYLVVSLMFWYLGLLPDLASLRDRARRRGQRVFYGLLALGWRGEARQWQRYETTTRLLAGFAVPLVFMVHSMVALDFSEGITPGWHTTLFPPFFVAGALFSGFAVVLTLAIPLRRLYGLHAYITPHHLDVLARTLLTASLVMAYSYLLEPFGAAYTGNAHELAMSHNRMSGAYAPAYWATLALNVALPQLLWWRSLRSREGVLLLVSIGVIVGMWLERFMLVVTSLYRGFAPSRWGMFYPTAWDWVHLFGSIGVFVLLLLLFVRLLPLLPMFEIRKQLQVTRQ
ncbi:MAG: polysulfide reductase NrfD [Gammaproteobacteria bacterium]|jgi:molybdopterin-containing oxidoreductase family membrane subunit